MSDYSYQDVLRMQEEAKARVMEMRRRSRFLAEDFAGREARAESGERRAEQNAECGVRNAELSHGAEPGGSSEFGVRNSELSHRGEPRCYEPPADRARAIRMPVEWPEGRETSSEFGVRNSELRQGTEEQTMDRGREGPRAERGERRAEMRQGTEAAVDSAALSRSVAGMPARRDAARENTGLSAVLRNVFGNMGEEETEKMFLLALCLLLDQENGDEGLMMAMMYLLT